MANSALIIGIDAYAPESGLPPRPTAVNAARQVARWLIEQELVAPGRVRLLCAPHDPEAGERPATYTELQQALQEVAQAGRATTEADRLYLFYAGHGLGATPEQLLLLPQDVPAHALGERVLPWARLERWLATTGFLQQFCFLDTTHITDARWQQAFIAARSPLPEPLNPPIPATPTQVTFYAMDTQPSPGAELPASQFGPALQAGLAGAAGSIRATDLRTGERVISSASLLAYLERELPTRSQGRQHCIVGGRFQDDPIIAHLGPAPTAELQILVEPEASISQVQVEIQCDSLELPAEVLTAPPFHLTLLQGLNYQLTARTPGYAGEEYCRITPGMQTVTLTLVPLSQGTLGIWSRECRLQINLTEPVLPVTLYDEAYTPIRLPKPGQRGSLNISRPAGWHFFYLETPPQPILHELEIKPNENKTAITLAPPTSPQPPDHLLVDVANRKRLPPPAAQTQAGLVLLTDNPAHSATPGLLRPAGGRFMFTPEASSRIDLPEQATIAAGRFVRGVYSAQPGLGQLLIELADGQRFQLVLPLPAGRITVVSITPTVAGYPAIELLLVPAALHRPDNKIQRRILWAQRFLHYGRWEQVRAILDDPEVAAEPLALALAGYAWLNIGNGERAHDYGERLQRIAPELDDGPLLLELAAAPAAAPDLDMHRVPLLNSVLLRHIPLQQDRTPAERARQANRTHLHRLLTNRFSDDELQTLCFDLGIDYDSLPGTQKVGKARELIRHCERRNSLHELIEQGKQLRPDINWDTDPQAGQRNAWEQFVRRIVPDQPWLLLRGNEDLSLLWRM